MRIPSRADSPFQAASRTFVFDTCSSSQQALEKKLKSKCELSKMHTAQLAVKTKDLT